MTTLREAVRDGKLNKFIRERKAEGSPAGDQAAFNATLQSMAGKSKAVPATSQPDRSAD